MNETTIIKVNGSEFQIAEGLQKKFVNAHKAIRAAANSSKLIAKALYSIKSDPDYPQGAKFPEVVESAFPELEMSGATAYKYAQAYEKIGETYPTIYDALPMGKLVKMLSLTTDKAKGKGSTPPAFVEWFMNEECDSANDIRTEYETKTAEYKAICISPDSTDDDKMKAFEAIQKLKTEYKEPHRDFRLNEDGSEVDPAEVFKIALVLLVAMPEKSFGEWVNDYLTAIGAKSEPKAKEETADDNGKERTPDTILDEIEKRFAELQDMGALTDITLIKAYGELKKRHDK